MIRHQAFVVEAEAEEGIKCVELWAEKELGMSVQENPDFVVLRHGLFSVEDARRVSELAAGVSFAGAHRVIVITASRAYHEAQNALLKLFEEPPQGTSVFLVLPTLGGLLPTLRSRVQILNTHVGLPKSHISEVAEEFMKISREKRSALIKKLTSGKDDEDRQERRDDAIQILNGVEAVAYAHLKKDTSIAILLSEIATLRGYLYDRSAPVRMILEHLSLVIPKGLV